MENELNSEPAGAEEHSDNRSGERLEATELEERRIEYRIEDGAVRLLASLAAQEVEGVVSRTEEDGELGSMARRRLVGSVELRERMASRTGSRTDYRTEPRASGAELKVTIAVYYGRNLAEVAREVQRRVAATLGAQASLEVGRVDVHVAEVVA